MRPSWPVRLLVGGAVAAVVAAGAATVALASGARGGMAGARPATKADAVVYVARGNGAVPVAGVSPAPGSTTQAPNGPITITFNHPVAAVLGPTLPTISPEVPGAWSEPSGDTLVFTPSAFGFGPATTVTVSFDRPVAVVASSSLPASNPAAAGPASGLSDLIRRALNLPSPSASNVATSAAAESYSFAVAPASMLRLEEILAQLQYLPLTFTPAPGVTLPTTLAGEVATMTQPLAGSFSWRWASTPASLQAQWTVGSANVLVKGALMAFDSVRGAYNGYQLQTAPVAQIADGPTWQALLQAAAADRLDPNPYSYVSVTKSLPESLTLWQDGAVVLTSPTNTGIASRPTADGTFPIYVRYTVNYMNGTNPNGTTYHDLVHWINYFNGGDAVHGFVRGSYGFPQSLGCVELPVPTAATAYSDLAIGDLVTVAG